MTILKRIFLAVLFVPLCAMQGDIQKKEVVQQASGSWDAIDKKGNKITLEWHKAVEGQEISKSEKQVLSQILPVMADAFADKALLFLEEVDGTLQIMKKYAAEVEDLYKNRPGELKRLINIANQYKNDRKKRVELTLKSLQQMVEQQEPKETNVSQNSKKDFPDQTFIVMAKNQKNVVLGYAIFRIKAEFAKNNVELDELAVAPAAQGCGLGGLLTTSILKLAPDTKRLFLGALIWNEPAQKAYKALGFSVYEQEGCSINFEATELVLKRWLNK